jgi:hypothetical protein
MTMSSAGRLEKVRKGFIRFLAMFAYLLVVLTMFQLHEYLVLEEHGIPFTRFGFAVVNALVLAKVMLVADELHLGESWSTDRPLIYPILIRSVLFAAVFIVFDIAEKTIKGLFEGKTLMASVPDIGGGVLGSVITGVILTVMLVPFFAFVEIGHFFGMEAIRRALLKEGRRRN